MHKRQVQVRKIPWGRKGQPTPVFCLENPLDRGARQATVHGVTRVRRDLATKPPPPTISDKSKEVEKAVYVLGIISNSLQKCNPLHIGENTFSCSCCRLIL